MSEKTIQEIIDDMTEEQQAAVYAMLGAALEGEMEHSDIDENSIIQDGMRNGSLRDSVLEHAEEYGIKKIETLFPNHKLLNNTPGFLNNNVEWVNKILGAVGKQPFSRVKTLMGDISKETIRAKGYTKAGLKTEEVFGLLKRTTEPTTIYLKQKIDRDDVLDITDFDVVAWIKQMMRMKLDEELARAILIGDGRLSSDPNKIDEECIRPIYNDEDLYTIKVPITVEPDGNKYKEFINACIRNRKKYRGSGNPTLFTTEETLSEMLLLEDAIGHRLYKTIEELKTVLRVSDIVTMDDMADLERDTDDPSHTHTVLGIIVNLKDYSIGADKGGQISLFDDFDIDYNQQKYLIETRCSGALMKPYSAMVIEEVTDAPSLPAFYEADEEDME